MPSSSDTLETARASNLSSGGLGKDIFFEHLFFAVDQRVDVVGRQFEAVTMFHSLRKALFFCRQHTLLLIPYVTHYRLVRRLEKGRMVLLEFQTRNGVRRGQWNYRGNFLIQLLASLSQRGAQVGQHAIPGNVAEGRKLQ